ncbi:serine/threonine-protein kinase [Amycolatopsis keratiniphila]|uniref:serine/threonine-protein kinase n=1 Tax=Amycolatopsis keratiniphila TaxID=129921 RepID=UPI00087D86FD|nr:serine/threonine-protein kinase [Amycolatopsis keratiniphila]OLZ52828.1 serine/threonine protein kinase [Amycolatopsis keratiniphila subsp. nogabecina]SDU08096.1 Serine/threonine protein kinase [Amycolatopsis keratiniphila]
MKPLNPGEPRQIGPYRIIAELGEGGMGRVVLGLAPDGRLVAVKQLHAQFAHDPRFRERFRREVATSRLVSGAYTAAVMDADAEAETPWLASVFVTGPSLKEAVDAAGPLPAESVRLLASGLAAALTEIHRAGLIHRDLKPSNIILTSDGPRVIDFGIARVAEEAQDLTGTGAIIGSPAFMSPEQAGSGQITGASDVFSLGAILVMAATGRGPFTGPTAPQTLYNVVHAEADFSAVPDEIRRVAEPCLAKDPARRPTPEQILDFLGPVPPGAAPWPPAVHARIRQQDTEVRSVLALPLPIWRPPPKKMAPRTKKILFGSLAAVVLLVVAGMVALGLAIAEHAKPENPGVTSLSANDALAAERLRLVDPCKVLAGRFVQEFGTLKPETGPIYPARCKYTGLKGVSFELRLGEGVSTSSVERTDRTAEGLPLLRSTISGGCDSVAQLPTDRRLGVVVSHPGREGDPCKAADDMLSAALTRLRTHEVDRTGDPASILPLDPCTVADPAVLGKAMPNAQPAPRTLRICEWVGGGDTLTVELQRGAYVPEGSPVDLGSGVTGDMREFGGSNCAVTWRHRPLPDREAEHVAVRLLAREGSGSPCDRAKEIAGSIASRLPGP